MMVTRFGPLLTRDGVSFRLWAPAAKTVDLLAPRAERMHPEANGWFSLDVQGARAGTLYRFRIDGELEVPDPASSFQPQDISGPSEVIDHDRFVWRAADWRGRPWSEAVFLETHVGTFTSEGTYEAAVKKLDLLADTGFTAIELMPLGDFAGKRNWGYDGVLWYAPDNIYGRPDDLKTFIDEAHLRGLMVFLDVVYNHFGPEGNYLPRYAPAFFSQTRTPWGSAIDYRVHEVRRFTIENALHWLSRYRFDGLRLDAIHAIAERGRPSILTDLSQSVNELAKAEDRHIHLVVENEDNTASLLSGEDGQDGQYRAQWNDDYHHAWHVLLTGEQHGYYEDYIQPLPHLARIIRSGFAYQGQPSDHRGGRPRGEPSGDLSPLAFVNFLQNHDQIGNRALGDRLVADEPAVEAALAVTLLAPMPPLMFMGEEWGASTPFPFFCDFHGELADAVRNGRRQEFKAAYERYGEAIPDPLDESTFRSAILNWAGRAEGASQKRLSLVRRLLAQRRLEIVPRLVNITFGNAHLVESVLSAHWNCQSGEALQLIANLSDRESPLPATPACAHAIWGGPLTQRLAPWAVIWSINKTQ